jgi:C-terminal processing protease CtpA/Prc
VFHLYQTEFTPDAISSPSSVAVSKINLSSSLPGMILQKVRRASFLFMCLGLVAVGMLLGAGWAEKGRTKEEDLILINSIKFRELLSLIHTDYIDKTDTDSLADAALETIVEELDPHSSYISKKDVFAGSVQLESNFEGIGAEFQFIDDTIWVSSVMKASPSEKAGLKAGDKILFVDIISTRASICASRLKGTCTHMVSPSKSALKA